MVDNIISSNFENSDDDCILDKVTVSSCSEEEASYERHQDPCVSVRPSVQKAKLVKVRSDQINF